MEIKQLQDNEEDKVGFELVYLKRYEGIKETPHCKKHGAMNCFPPDKTGRRIWRCLSEYHRDKDNKFWDRTCPACCYEDISKSMENK